MISQHVGQQEQSASVLLCLQESKAQATRLLDQARQWMVYTSGIAEILGERLPPDMSWLVLRPVLRLLLWLVPEHAPEPMEVAAAAQAHPALTGSGMQGHEKHRKASAPMTEDWRCSLVLAYIRDIAEVGDQVQLACLTCWESKFGDVKSTCQMPDTLYALAASAPQSLASELNMEDVCAC
jgi:hypothetical protein